MKKLHQLINSLSQGEKRFVKIRLNGNKSDSSLTSHFELLSKQKVYNFDKLVALGGRSVKLTQSNLSLLYEVVLKHLRSYSANKSVEQNFRDDLIDIKTLMNKGLIEESKIQCLKLIKKANIREEFEILKSAYKDLWNIHMLNGNLSESMNSEIQHELIVANKNKQELIDLEAVYRDATTIYYQYFFHKRDSKFQDDIKSVTENINRESLQSAKAKHVFFEIKAVEYIVLGNIDSHHELRKEQLYHLISSKVFESDDLHRLLVLSNLFIKLKSKGFINELSTYLDFMEDYFFPTLSVKRDSVFMEKYYDIYFLNQCYHQTWSPDPKKILELTKLFKDVIAKNHISNHILIGRIYLSLAELYILTGNNKSAIPLLVDFFNLSKKNKYSKHYIEGDIHFIVANYLMNKHDTFENSLEALNRKIRRNELELDPDQLTLLEVLNSMYKNDIKDIDYYLKSLKNRQSYRIYIHKLIKSNSIDEIRKEYFIINDSNYVPKEDVFLSSIREFC